MKNKSFPAVVAGVIALVLSLVVPTSAQATVELVDLDPAVVNGFGAEDIVVNPVTNRVYTVNTATNSVSVVNGDTGVLVTNIQVGNSPFDARVNKTSNKVYVINGGDDTVSVIDGASNTVTGTVSVGTTPYSIKIIEGTNRIYVLNLESASVSVINGVTDTVEATVAVDPYPTGIDVIKKSGERSVYVASAGTGNVSVIGATPGSPGFNTVTATIPLGLTTWERLKVAGNDVTDQVYVVNRGWWLSPVSYGEAGVVVIDADPANTGIFHTVTATIPLTGVYRATKQKLNETTGYLYLVANDTDIVMLDMATNTIVDTLAFYDDVNDLAVNDNTGRIYAALDNGRLIVIDGDPASASFHSIIADVDSIWSEVLAVNKTANHLFASISEGGVLDFDGATNMLAQFVSTGGTTYGLALDSAGGKLWVAHTSTSGLKVVDTATRAVTDPGLGVPIADIILNPGTGRLYAAELVTPSIRVIDTATQAEETDITLAGFPLSWDLNPQTNRLYLLDGNQLKVIDADPASPGFNDFILPHVTLGTSTEGIGINENTNLIYVGEGANDATPTQISAINGATNAVVTTIEVGIGADVIAVNHATNRIYTSNDVSHSISVIDGDPASPSFHTVIATIPLASNPEYLLVNEETNRLYVNVDGNSTIAVIDCNTNTVEAELPVPYSEELQLALDPDVNYIYATDEITGVLYSIDGEPAHTTTFNTVVESIDVGNGSWSLAVDPLSHQVYVSNEQDDTLSIVAADTDSDGILNGPDNCAVVSNANQVDTDGDGAGDACDTDSDGDGVPDSSDAFPLDPSEWLDTDGDGTGNNADPDDDGDGFDDATDAFPLDPAEWLDTDGNGIGNNADPDDDGDGIPDGSDNCTLVINVDQADLDGDGSGDACDLEDDADGIPDVSDTFPLDTDNDGLDNTEDADDDGDSIPDLYEEANNLDPLNAADAAADNDGDGVSNLVEYQEGTDPNDPISLPPSEAYEFERLWPTLKQPWYFSGPTAVAIDKDGFVFIADTNNHRIVKMTSDGVVVATVSIGNDEQSGVSGFPRGIAIDGNGNIYVTEGKSHSYRIQKYTNDLVSMGSYTTSSDPVVLNWLEGLAVDSQGYIYHADTGSDKIYKYSPDGSVAGQWGGSGSGPGQFNYPRGIALDQNDQVYVVDSYNNRVQKFTPEGVYVSEFGGEGNGPGQLSKPDGIAIDSQGYLYVSDSSNYRIQKFASDGSYVTEWSLSFSANNGSVYDGPASGVAVDAQDRIYLTRSKSINVFTAGGVFLAGWGSISDEVGKFNSPAGLVVDDAGNVYVGDSVNFRITKFDPEGSYLDHWSVSNNPYRMVYKSNTIYTSMTWNEFINYATDGSIVSQFSVDEYIWGFDVDADGYIYAAARRGDASTGVTGLIKYASDGSILAEELNFDARDVTIRNGYIYVAVPYGYRRYDTNLNFVDDYINSGLGNGQFMFPGAIISDDEGNIYIADDIREDIQKLTGNGVYLATIGAPGLGVGLFNYPRNIAVDGSGVVYVIDGSIRVQKFSPASVTDNNRAIVVAGGGPFPGNHLWEATQANANFAYRTLTYQGFTKENIRYLSQASMDLDQNGLQDDMVQYTNDGNAKLQDAIGTWAADADNLVLYIVDHGGAGTVRLSGTETLDASALGAWLDGLQAGWQAAGKPGRVTLVYDACESGTFQNALASTVYDRDLITSTSPGESAYFVSQGSLSFSNHFWTHIFYGGSVGGAYAAARDSMQLAFPEQNAQLEVNGNGVPNETGAGGDEEQAATLYIGRGTVIIMDAPVIGGVSPAQNLDNSATATLYADNVTDADGIARVWAVLRPPGYAAQSTDNPVQGLPTVELLPHPTIAKRWEATYAGFTQPGIYDIAIYALDSNLNTSIPQVTSVTVGTPLARRAVIVVGGSTSDADWPGRELAGTVAYEALKAQGYADTEIKYFSPTTVVGVELAPSIPFLEDALTVWAGSDTQDVVLYLTGETDGSEFHLTDSDTLPAAQLDSWLDSLQSTLPGRLTVALDADNAGVYLARLTAPAGMEENRFRLASTISGNAHLEGDGSVSWSQYFWGNVANGATLPVAHLLAKQAMFAASNGQQVAWLDSDSDGIGDKFDLSRIINYSLGPGILLAGDDPVIGSVGIDETNLNGDPMQLTLWAQDITTTGTLDAVWALVTPPDIDGPGGTAPVPVEVPLTFNGTRYEAGYSLPAPAGGTYSVTFYARDTDEAVSLPSKATVTRMDSYEVDDTHGEASDIVVDGPVHYHSFHVDTDVDWVWFDHDESADPDVIYTIKADTLGSAADLVLTLADDNGATVQGPLDDTPAGDYPFGAEVMTFNPTQSGIYKVKVSLDTSLTNQPSDYLLSVSKSGGGTGSHTSIEGIIADDNGAPLPLVSVYADDGAGHSDWFLTGSSGLYSLKNLPVGDYSLTITDNSGSGYQATIVGPPHPVNLASAEATAVVNITMALPLQDADGDGLADGSDPYPNDVDGDGDGLVDGWDGQVAVIDYSAGVDGNNDGYVDGELDYGTLATVPDSDGDGYNDGMEVRYGSHPMLDTDTPQNNHLNNGDINGDGMVDVVDVLLVTRMALGQYQPVNDEEWIRADVVPDPLYLGQVNAGDLLRIQQLALGM